LRERELSATDLVLGPQARNDRFQSFISQQIQTVCNSIASANRKLVKIILGHLSANSTAAFYWQLATKRQPRCGLSYLASRVGHMFACDSLSNNSIERPTLGLATRTLPSSQIFQRKQMQLRNILAIIPSLFLAVACGANNSQQVKPNLKSTEVPAQVPTHVELDLTTPDRALKSYWKIQDKIRAEHFLNYTAQLPTFHRIQASAEKVMTRTAFDDVKEKSGRLESFNRNIIDVKVESESRAVIITSIKNSTPVPVGAELSKFEEQSRSEGDKYKYVLEKHPPGWQVAEIWDFKTYSTPPSWSKIIPSDGKPFISSSTYEGR
jgi:hypothetical protein